MKRNSLRPAVESLEGRDLMAAGVTGSWAGGVLTLYGTNGNDTITVRQSGNTVTVDGFSGSVDARQVQRINIPAGAGNDTINLLISPQLASRVFADGGGGYDTLTTPGNLAAQAGFEYRHGTSTPTTTSGNRVAIVPTNSPDTSMGKHYFVLHFNTGMFNPGRWIYDLGSYTLEAAHEEVKQCKAASYQVAGILDTQTGRWVQGGLGQTPQQPADKSYAQYQAAIDTALQRWNTLWNQVKNYKGWLTLAKFNEYNQAVDAYNAALQDARNSPTYAINRYFKDSPNYRTKTRLTNDWVIHPSTFSPQYFTLQVRRPGGNWAYVINPDGTAKLFGEKELQAEQNRLLRINPAFQFRTFGYSRRF